MSKTARSCSTSALLVVLVLLTGGAVAVQGRERAHAVIGLVPSSDPVVTRALADGARLALEEARAGDVDLRLVVGAGGRQWANAASSAVSLAFDERAIALISPPERKVAHLLAQVGTRAHVPVLSTCSVATVFGTGSIWVFGVVSPRGPAYGAARVEFDAPPPIDPAAAPDFVRAFEARYGRAPDAWARVGYAAARRLAQAAGRVGTDRWALAVDLGQAR